MIKFIFCFKNKNLEINDVSLCGNTNSKQCWEMSSNIDSPLLQSFQSEYQVSSSHFMRKRRKTDVLSDVTINCY